MEIGTRNEPFLVLEAIGPSLPPSILILEVDRNDVADLEFELVVVLRVVLVEHAEVAQLDLLVHRIEIDRDLRATALHTYIANDN